MRLALLLREGGNKVRKEFLIYVVCAIDESGRIVLVSYLIIEDREDREKGSWNHPRQKRKLTTPVRPQSESMTAPNP